MAAPNPTSETDALTAINKRFEELGFDPKYVGYKGSLDKPIQRLKTAQEGIKGKKRVDTTPLKKSGRAWSRKLTPEQRGSMAAYKEYDAAREDVARRASESLNTPKDSLMTRQEAARMVVDQIARAEREKQYATSPEPTKPDENSEAARQQQMDKLFADRARIAAQNRPTNLPYPEYSTEAAIADGAPKMPSSMAPATLGLYSPEADRLEKRQLLAEELRKFASGTSDQTAESLVEQGSEVGVSRGQLSNLYKQYRKDIGSDLMAGPPKPESQSRFEREEEQARARSQASGAFGGEGQIGESSKGFVTTPNLDRLAQMQSEPVGSRTMESETRMITSPAGQMRLMARKADRAGINIGQLIAANRGDVMAAFGELEASGLGARGIRSQEEVRARPALGEQMREAKADLLKRQAEEIRKAEAERIAKEKEEADRKEKERLAAIEEGDTTALRDEDEEERSPRRSTINPNSRPTNPNRV